LSVLERIDRRDGERIMTGKSETEKRAAFHLLKRQVQDPSQRSSEGRMSAQTSHILGRSLESSIAASRASFVVTAAEGLVRRTRVESLAAP
jgi:hypothetical protein